MPVLGTLTALLAAGAPPAAVPDARFAVAVYCQASCDTQAMTALEAALGARFTVGDTLPLRAEAGRAVLTLIPSTELGLPDAATLDSAGVGLSGADAGALAESDQVVLIEAAVPTADAAPAQAALNQAALRFAAAERGWLEDLETREVFSMDQWQALRVDSLVGAPAIWGLIRVESYPVGDEGLERMITYGLDKFGLHEISVSDVHPAFSDDVAAALLLMAAQGIEGSGFTSETPLDLSGLHDPAARAMLSGYQWTADRPGVELVGTGRATVRLIQIPPQEGDNPGPQVQLIPTGDGTQAENLGALLDGLWGYGGAPAVADDEGPDGATEGGATESLLKTAM